VSSPLLVVPYFVKTDQTFSLRDFRISGRYVKSQHAQWLTQFTVGMIIWE